MATTPMHERAYALSCDLLKLFLVHGIRQDLRRSLTDKQREQPLAFQASILARNIANGHASGWKRDLEYQAQQDAKGGR